MYSTDKIAILLATYNGEKYISEQIESILHQSEQGWVLYIHDDGSTDNTVDIIRAYADNYSEQIVVIDGPPTGGAKNNFFYLMREVEAPYYMCADQDDVWLPEKIALTRERMKMLEGKELPCLVFTELKVVDSNLNILSEQMSIYQGLDCKNISFNRTLIQNVVTGCTMMFNRSQRDEMVKVTDTKDIRMHDWWATLIALRFGRISYIETPTILYRQHGDNGVGARNSASMLYNMKRMLQGEEIKQSLEENRLQAQAFYEYAMECNREDAASSEKDSNYKNELDQLTYEFVHLNEKGKLSRLLFYKKNDVKKSTWKKNVGLVIWG